MPLAGEAGRPVRRILSALTVSFRRSTSVSTAARICADGAAEHYESSSGGESHPSALPGRVENWRADS